MSETLTDPTLGVPPAANAPGDASTAAAGSVGAAPTQMVEAERFNGLMSAHQKALDELRAERERRIALETQTGATQVPEDNAVLDEVKTLRQELAEQRIATARAEAIARHPEAAAFADLVQGRTPAEIESVAATIAQRVSALGLGATPQENPPTTPDPAPAASATAPVVPTAEPVTAPVFPGGATPPSEPISQAEKMAEALKAGSWDKFWEAKFTTEQRENLA